MEERSRQRITGKCLDCGGMLELVELDIQGKNKIMQCKVCGLFHLYKKDFLGNYKLTKVTKRLSNNQYTGEMSSS
jgi:hypothetical protein